MDVGEGGSCDWSMVRAVTGVMVGVMLGKRVKD